MLLQRLTRIISTLVNSHPTLNIITKTELVKPDEYTAGFRPKGKGNNWTTVSRKLANISKNNLIVRATSTWDFSIKIGKFSFSRNKYSSKSNLSMK